MTLRNTAVSQRKGLPDKMYFERFLRSKKADDVGQMESGRTVRGTLIGIIFVLVMVSIIMTTTTLYAGEVGQDTIMSFENFVGELRQVANGTKDVGIVELMSIDSDQVIVAFDIRPSVVDTCQEYRCMLTGYGCEEFPRPPHQNCIGKKLCVCVCQEDEACENPYDCKGVDNSLFTEIASETTSEFDANLGRTYSGDKAYAMLYGDCDGWQGEPIQARDIVIEKEGNIIRISDNACGNQKSRGIKGQCIKQVQGQANCGTGKAPISGPQYKCEDGFTCCI
jgi:hypothetical protein